MLESVGLDEFTERVYRVVLTRSPVSLAELTELLPDLTAAAARKALETLLQAELMEQLGGRPARYSAVDPRLGLAALIRSRRDELDRTASALKVYAAEFHERMPRTDMHRLIEVIEGPAAITARLSELMAGAEHEVRAYDAPPYATVEQLAVSERTLRRRITDLTARLGATSRFQAGAQAVRRGWL